LYNSSASYEFKVLDKDKFSIREVRGEDEEIELGEQSFGKPFTTDLGKMKISWNHNFSEAHK